MWIGQLSEHYQCQVHSTGQYYISVIIRSLMLFMEPFCSSLWTWHLSVYCSPINTMCVMCAHFWTWWIWIWISQWSILLRSKRNQCAQTTTLHLEVPPMNSPRDCCHDAYYEHWTWAPCGRTPKENGEDTAKRVPDLTLSVLAKFGIHICKRTSISCNVYRSSLCVYVQFKTVHGT